MVENQQWEGNSRKVKIVGYMTVLNEQAHQHLKVDR